MSMVLGILNIENKKCVQCGKIFTITDSEKRFFESKNLSFPKRCKDCREKNNPRKVKASNEQVTHRKEKTVEIKKGYLIVAILIIVFSAFYLNSEINYKGNHIEQKANVSDNYSFRSESLLQEHFSKHGDEFGLTSASQYESRANDVIKSPDALHKIEAEDGDSIYYIQATNELVIISTDGYIRTYFKPEDGRAYYNKQ